MNLGSKKSSVNYHSSSSLPKSQKSYQKQKGITKPEKSQEDHKLSKGTTTQRADKKITKRKGSHQMVGQSDVSKAFSVHSTNFINFDQCLFSLKLLGCMCDQEGQYSKLKSLWREKGEQPIDFSQFQQIYQKLYPKENLQTTRELFFLLSKQKSTINFEILNQMAQLVGWKGDLDQIFKEIGSNNSISFEEFSQTLYAQNAIL